MSLSDEPPLLPPQVARPSRPARCRRVPVRVTLTPARRPNSRRPLPDPRRHHLNSRSWPPKFLFEMEGKLAMSCCELKGWTADLWLMEDYKNEIWVREYRIKLPVAEIINLKEWGNIFWDVVIVSQEGDMLVECLFAVLHCDKKGKLQRTFYSDGRSLLFSRHVLKESLVPHAFLQMQQDGGAGGLPFFRGL